MIPRIAVQRRLLRRIKIAFLAVCMIFAGSAVTTSSACAQVYPYAPDGEAIETIPLRSGGSPRLPPVVEEGFRLYASGAFDTAATALEPIVANGTASADVHAVYVAALLRSGRADAAALAAEAGTVDHPTHAGLHLLHGKALLQSNAPEQALAAYDATAAHVERGRPLPPGIDADTFRDEWGRVHLIAGSRAMQQGATTDAETLFRTAERRMSDPVPAMTQRAFLYLEQGRMQDAANLTARALEQAPDAVGLLQIHAQSLYETDQYDQLVPIYQRLYELRPDDVNIGLAYGQALLLNEQMQPALVVFQRLLNDFPRERRVYDVVVDLYRRSLNYQGAVEVIEQQQTFFPDDVTLPWTKAELYEQIGDFDQARAVYDSLVVAHPSRPRAVLAAARTFVQADSMRAALDRYRGAAQAFPEDPDVQAAYARTLQSEAVSRPELWPEVREAYQSLAANATGSARAAALVGLGTALEALTRQDSARAAYTAALGSDSSSARAYYRLAVLSSPEDNDRFHHAEMALRESLREAEQTQGALAGSMQRGQFESARAYSLAEKMEATGQLAADAFTFFGDRFPIEQTEPVILDVLETFDASGRLLYLTGRYYDAHDREADALRFYERATREAPDLRDAHLALGRHHADAGRTRAAILSYERALGTDESHPDAYQALIGLYRTQGRLDMLVRRWQSRLRATPANDVLREHLVDALHRAGRHDEARAIAAGNAG